jgi:hypothetical protein
MLVKHNSSRLAVACRRPPSCSGSMRDSGPCWKPVRRLHGVAGCCCVGTTPTSPHIRATPMVVQPQMMMMGMLLCGSYPDGGATPGDDDDAPGCGMLLRRSYPDEPTHQSNPDGGATVQLCNP